MGEQQQPFQMQNKYGLQPLKKKTIGEVIRGKIDYSHSKTFGAFDIKQLPDEYMLVSDILDQGSLPHCTAYASCAIQESQHGIKFDPEDFYEAEGVINGKVQDFGYDMRVAMKTGKEYGFKPLSGGNPTDYQEGGYFDIDGPYDLFDNIRVALWLAREEKKTAQLGTMWYEEWENTPNGIIDESIIAKTPIGLHDIKGAGWKTINGILYIVIQNSWGKNNGDGGLYYFSRTIVNKEFKEGHFLWRTKGEIVKTQLRILELMKRILEILKEYYGSIFKK